MDKIKISKSLEEEINYLLKYYGGVKNNVLVIHAKEGWNEQYREVNDLDSITLAQILLGDYELALTEQDLDNEFRFKIEGEATEYKAVKVNGRYAVGWIEDGKVEITQYSVQSVLSLVESKSWKVL